MTVAERFGDELADRLAMWAIDALCSPPTRIATGTTRIATSLVNEGREILDETGFDWRAWKAARGDGRMPG